MKAGIGDRCARALVLVLGALLLAACSHESADWKQATLANSTEAYQAFLQQHPHSPEAVQAQTRIKDLSAQRDWQIASAADTREAYQQFVSAHPDSKWVQEARIRIENFAQAGVSGGAALAGSGNTAPAGALPAPDTAALPARPSATAPTASATPAPTPAPAMHPAPRTVTPSARGATRASSPRHDVRVAASTAHAAHARAHTHASVPGRVVQLGAFRTRAQAQSEWKTLCARFGVLRSLTPRYVAGRSRGARVYRLQVHLSSPAAASGLCTTLRRHARPCLRINA